MNIRRFTPLALGVLAIAGACAAASGSEMEMTVPKVTATPFEIDSFRFLVHLSGPGSPSVSDFEITRPLDSISLKLAEAAAKGTGIPTATIEICYPDCSAPTKELTYTFEDAFLKSDVISALGPSPQEQLTFAFEQLTVSYSGDGSSYDELRELHPWTTVVPPTAPTGPGAPADLAITETLDAFDLLTSDQVAPGGVGENLPDTLVDTTPIPEPATLSLLGLGFAAIGLTRRRKKT